MPDYTKFTNLEVTGHLKVAGQEVTPGGGGGGSSVLVVNLTYDEEIDGLIADKTYAEVIAAPYVVFISAGDTTYYYPICDYGEDSDGYFYVHAVNGTQDFVNLYALTANDYLSTTYPPIPD